MVRIGILFLLCFPTGLFAQTVSFAPPTLGETGLLGKTAFCESLFQAGKREKDRIFADYGNLYNKNNAKNFGVVLLGAGILANTKMDGNFQNWHNKHIRSGCTDEFSKGSKFFGEGQIFIPVMAATAFSYRFFQERRALPECYFGEFADRTVRGYLVGTPVLLVSQWVLGGGRPNFDMEHPSRWQPFKYSNAVSGHAFMGAVPFITAAQMTDRPLVKGLFYALSVCTAWSRINDDAHYLSQSILGWYLAYLSVQAVSRTESAKALPRGLTIFPVGGDGSVGIGLHYQY